MVGEGENCWGRRREVAWRGVAWSNAKADVCAASRQSCRRLGGQVGAVANPTAPASARHSSHARDAWPLRPWPRVP